MIDLDAFPETGDISDLIITEEQYESSRFQDVWPVFLGDKNPYASTPEMKNYVSWFKDKPEAEKLEMLVNLMRDKNSLSQRVLALLRIGPKNLGTYYNASKIETENAQELFEHAKRHGSVPLICVEHTLLFLALGNAANLNVGAYTVPTFREKTEIASEPARGVRREHVVPAVFIKKPNKKFAVIQVKSPSGEPGEELLVSYPDAEPLNWFQLTLSYINNYARSLEKKLFLMDAHRRMLDYFLSQHADASSLLMMNRAFELYDKKQYSDAKELFLNINKKHEKIHGTGPSAHAEAKLYIAKCDYQLRNYEGASNLFKAFFPPQNNTAFWKKSKGKYNLHSELSQEKLDYRGVHNPLALAEGMIQWADAIQELNKQKGSADVEDDKKVKFLRQKAKDFGWAQKED